MSALNKWITAHRDTDVVSVEDFGPAKEDDRLRGGTPLPGRLLRSNRRVSVLVKRDEQYLSIRYTGRLALAGIERPVGSVGDPYDNAPSRQIALQSPVRQCLAETINGLYKAEVIHRLGPCKTMASIEWETLKWVD
jgi:transposase InsO family protein